MEALFSEILHWGPTLWARNSELEASDEVRRCLIGFLPDSTFPPSNKLSFRFASVRTLGGRPTAIGIPVEDSSEFSKNDFNETSWLNFVDSSLSIFVLQDFYMLNRTYFFHYENRFFFLLDNVILFHHLFGMLTSFGLCPTFELYPICVVRRLRIALDRGGI